VNVSDWFAARTYLAGDFRIPDLAARKAAQDLSVSVVLPARNEAPTVGGVVDSVMELTGSLVDEVVVMDGGSIDGTAEVAARAGARVHQDAEVLPEFGPPRGKGDALWRSLAVTSGDIVVFVDADIRNPHARFVWGLLGPLLTEPAVQLVKGFYDRPIEVGGDLQPSGGGRVTELLARPLLNLLWPDLSGLVQPLSGEYAGRRNLLEAIPFFSGYGVEFGMLVDTVDRAGADAIAQVDLSERVHRNQTLADLSRMAFGIAQVAMRRLQDEGRAGPDIKWPSQYVQFARSGRRIAPEGSDVEIIERPSMADVRARR
jgi:glucosyl-3-phosphoglycerate synthase